MRRTYKLLLIVFLVFCGSAIRAQDGYDLWLSMAPIEDTITRNHYRTWLKSIYIDGGSIIRKTIQHELQEGLSGMLDTPIAVTQEQKMTSGLVVKIAKEGSFSDNLIAPEDLEVLQAEGYLLQSVKRTTGDLLLLTAKDDRGLLYGAFHLLKLIKQGHRLEGLKIISNPKVKLRVLNHWDNLDRTVERGYAGFSIWNWHQLPEYLDQRYYDYARANASVGINGAVVTNVNANALVFRSDYLEKTAALANVFRAYGMKIYLTARFSSPIEAGGLATADPLDPQVQQWWKDKVQEIYDSIPDFGGFLVKANSEGQPGPQQYGRTHADGANMLADALAPYGGVVMWRAFVYSEEEPEDRFKQAYNEFVPLDGTFKDNILIQVKNGPIDFQPREPIHPMFGAMPKTPLMMEFQITKEYLGQGTHLVGLANMYKEVLETDTYAKGEGSSVASVIDGTLDNHQLTGMAGVANIGTARNWTGNLFGQADWYTFGRLAWDPYLSAEEIFNDWSELTFGKTKAVTDVVVQLLDQSHETCVRYMTPLGLHHIMAAGHHYGPGPWVSEMSRADWTSVYYHRADSLGIGFDRTRTGSNAVAQYPPPLQKKYSQLATCPEKFLLWFHHVDWDYRLKNGNTLWAELCHQYQQGANEVVKMQAQWQSLEGKVNAARFRQVAMHLEIQAKEAQWWRDACLAYFHLFSQRPYPDGCPAPVHDFEYYKSLSYPYAPGIRPQW